MSQVVVHKGRTNTLAVQLAFDISGDTITSEIRSGQNAQSPLIAEWNFEFKTDGTDGAFLLILDDTTTAAIPDDFGYMDIKRVSDGEPVQVFESPMQVVFKDVITQ